MANAFKVNPAGDSGFNRRGVINAVKRTSLTDFQKVKFANALLELGKELKKRPAEENLLVKTTNSGQAAVAFARKLSDSELKNLKESAERSIFHSEFSLQINKSSTVLALLGTCGAALADVIQKISTGAFSTTSTALAAVGLAITVGFAFARNHIYSTTTKAYDFRYQISKIIKEAKAA